MSTENLADLLIGLGADGTAAEVLDLLWLAPQITPPRERADVGPDGPASERTGDRTASSGRDTRPENDPESAEGALAASMYMPQTTAQATPGLGIPAASIRAPQAPALDEKLELSRSLKLLKRHGRSSHDTQIDEIASAQSVAETRIWIPAMRPKPRRWMDLALVVDASESMDLWRSTAADFRDVLEDLGAFRDIRFWSLDWPGSDSGPRIRSADGMSYRSPKELIRPSGDRMILIFSDCISTAWQSRPTRQVLCDWAEAGPVAIVQPLPQRLWDHTAVVPAQVSLCAPEAGAANSKLKYEIPDGYSSPPDVHLGVEAADGEATADEAAADEAAAGDETEEAEPAPGEHRPPIPVPIVELTPTAMANWTRLVTAVGTGVVDGAVMLLTPEDEAAGPPAAPERQVMYSAEQLVRRFQLVASPAAMRLAECLSAAPVSVPVMRLIQKAVLRHEDQTAVAEVFLGGLLRKLPGASSETVAQYDFVPGVRSYLSKRLPRGRALDVLIAVADQMGQSLGRTREFRALIAGDAIDGDILIDPAARPFAMVAARVLNRLGGSFAVSGQRMRAALTLAAGSDELVDDALDIEATDTDLPDLGRNGSSAGPAMNGAAATDLIPADDPGVLDRAAPPDVAPPVPEVAPPDAPGPEPEAPGPEPEAPGPEPEAAAEGSQAPAGSTSINEFTEALRGIELPPGRAPERPLVCPYCYHAFAARNLMYRCEGDTAPGRTPCVPATDEVLEREMNISTRVLPAFSASTRGDTAPCPRCGGESRLQICPHCHASLPSGFRSLNGKLVAFIGPINAGKTALMTVLIHELTYGMGEQLSASIVAADDDTYERFADDYEEPLYEQGVLFDQTTTPRMNYVPPLVFRLTLPDYAKRRERTQEVLLSFADGAGEDLVQPGKVDLMARYLMGADAVVITIDPLQLPTVRQELPGDIALPPVPQDPMGSLERITRLLVAGAKTDVIDKPVAVVLTKLDAIRDLLPGHAVLRTAPPAGRNFDWTDSDRVQDEVERFLRTYGADELTRTLRRRYSNWRYFAVSALGAPPTSENNLSSAEIRPHRIADPVLWILSDLGMLQTRGKVRS
jgi:hypothetical protein